MNWIEGLFVKGFLKHVFAHWPAHLLWVFPVVTWLSPSIQTWDKAHPDALASQIGAVVLSAIARYVSPRLAKKGAALLVFALFLLPAAPARAQTPATGTPSLTTTSAAVMARIGQSYEAGTDLIGTYSLSDHWAARVDGYIFPTPGISATFAGAQFAEQIKKSEFSWAINGGVGTVSSTEPSMHFAAQIGGSLNWSPKGEPKISIVLVSGNYIYGDVMDAGQSVNSWATVYTGLQINVLKLFGAK